MNEDQFELNGMIYAPSGIGRSRVDTFQVGDCIGRVEHWVIVKSEPDPSDPNDWSLAWIDDTGVPQDAWTGPRTATDWRWVPTTYIIDEEAP